MNHSLLRRLLGASERYKHIHFYILLQRGHRTHPRTCSVAAGPNLTTRLDPEAVHDAPAAPTATALLASNTDELRACKHSKLGRGHEDLRETAAATRSQSHAQTGATCTPAHTHHGCRSKEDAEADRAAVTVVPSSDRAARVTLSC